VTRVGTTDRVLDIPRKPWVVGWWADGVGSGSDHGTTVLAAHLTTVRYGDGPFVRAPDLVPGDAMTLTDAEGRNRAYTVETVKTYIKTALPYERLFTQTGPPRVVLVTCGGTYRPETGHWDSNVVVTFVPHPGSA
jgi:sortase (surface protein transpeptidase)